MEIDKKIFLGGFLTAAMSIFIAPYVLANNLQITNVSLQDRNPSANTVVVQLDISWENAWRTKINHDAVWVTVRLNEVSVSPTDKRLCELTQSGLNPTGIVTGTGTSLVADVPSDKKGVFIRLSSFGEVSSVSAQNVRLTVDYSTCGFDANSQVSASVIGIEMVYIPKGAFYAGDNGGSMASLVQGTGDMDPWYIADEKAISVSNPAADGFRYVSGGNNGEDGTGSTFTIPTNFSKGYAPFYVMKYEINEGQWMEFINSLSTAEARAAHDITDNLHKNSDAVKYRNTIGCTGTPLGCTTQRPSRAMSFLNWMDLTAFLDWVALRPMTELEFEKAARGPELPVSGQFAWGTTNIVSASVLSNGEESGSEQVINTGANAHYGNIALTGGDTVFGGDYVQGVLRNGIFATENATRASAGGSYYGVMELSGNLYERVVTIGNASGRNFQGTNGDGKLTETFNYEGNATNQDWPGIDSIVDRGVTSALGSGYKGGAFDDLTSESLRISDRYAASYNSASVGNNSGGRGARSHEINN